MTTPQAAIFSLADALDQYRRLVRYLQKNTNPEDWAAHGDWAKLDCAADSALTLAAPFLPGSAGSARTATTTHTPGPWRIAPLSGGTDYAADINADGDALVPVYTLATAYNHPDAVLMAAAPDLLEALHDLLWAFDPEPGGAPIANHTKAHMVHRAYAAIAKAKGQQA